MTEENIEVISKIEVAPAQQTDVLDNRQEDNRRPSVAWTDEPKPETQRATLPVNTEKILKDGDEASDGSQADIIDRHTEDSKELKSNDSHHVAIETKHPSTVKSSSTKKSGSNKNGRNKTRKGSNKSLITFSPFGALLTLFFTLMVTYLY